MEVAVIRGDGIGVDVTNAALQVVAAVQGHVGGFDIATSDIAAGAGYYLEHGVDIEPGGEEAAGEADAILLGAIGLPSVRHPDGTEIAPHLRLRDLFGLYAGVRPVKAYPNAVQRLADERAAGIDLIILRESTEGLFYSAAVHGRTSVVDDQVADEIMRVTRGTTERLCDFALRLATRRKARGGRGKVTCVDKANVFTAFAFFRRIFDERAAAFPDLEVGHNYVDAQALDLIRRPWDFDVLVMENMFGDILSDLAGGLVGGMGMAACAEIGDAHGLFQPAHGSAPDIMGEDKANPLAAILSAGLMLDYLGERHENPNLGAGAQLIDEAVNHAFASGEMRPMEFGGDMGTIAATASVIRSVEALADRVPDLLAANGG